MIKYIFSLLLFTSCNYAQNKNPKVNNNVQNVLKDTLITYNLEGISAEGAEVKVEYKSGKISKSKTTIYGETGKAIITFEFERERIKVFESQYSYKKDLENIEADEDIQLIKELTYDLDYKGNVIEGSAKDGMDIFQEFKRTIPFTLK